MMLPWLYILLLSCWHGYELGGIQHLVSLISVNMDGQEYGYSDLEKNTYGDSTIYIIFFLIMFVDIITNNELKHWGGTCEDTIQ